MTGQHLTMAVAGDDDPTPTTGAKADDGGDVADARDPDVIQREIEQTRAELADTIDAIADRLSPKRAAGRGAAAVKAQVSSVLDRGGRDNHRSESDAPASLLDAPDGGSSSESEPSRADAVKRIAIEGGGTQFMGTSRFSTSRSLRADRLLLVVGVGAAVTAVIVLRRSRH